MTFFDPNTEKYPEMKSMTKNILDVTLNVGDCLYIPELYYYQSRTLDDESMFMLLRYQSSSKLTNLLNMGIEQGILD